MSNQYVIKSRDHVYEEYAVFVAEKVRSEMSGDIDWGLSSTDEIKEATKFTFINDAFVMMEDVGLHEDDWEVVPVQ